MRGMTLPRAPLALAALLLGALLLPGCGGEEPAPTAGAAESAADDQWKEKRSGGILQLDWPDLIPTDVDPQTLYDKVSRQSLMTPENEDPFSQAVLAVTRAISARSPVVDSLNGEQVRLSGLVVPLEWHGDTLNEFLLVPYLGACVHVPPPPANQIVYVRMQQEPVDMLGLFDAVTVTGTLLTVYSEREEGDAAYTLEAERVEPYE